MDIDLNILTDNGRVHNLTGKPAGINAREFLNLKELDRSSTPVNVIVPEHIYAISSSFFLGMFSESLQNLGGKDEFLQHYKFSADQNFMEQVEEGIKRWSTKKPSLGKSE